MAGNLLLFRYTHKLGRKSAKCIKLVRALRPSVPHLLFCELVHRWWGANIRQLCVPWLMVSNLNNLQETEICALGTCCAGLLSHEVNRDSAWRRRNFHMKRVHNFDGDTRVDDSFHIRLGIAEKITVKMLIMLLAMRLRPWVTGWRLCADAVDHVRLFSASLYQSVIDLFLIKMIISLGCFFSSVT